MAKSKKPTGLNIARNGEKFTLSWKRGENYNKQDLEYTIKKKSGSSKKSPSVSASLTKKVIKIDFDDYYPNNKVYLRGLSFTIKGHASGESWAGNSDTFTLKALTKPKLNTDLTSNNVCKFTWTCNDTKTGEQIYTDVYWESVLLKDNSTTSTKKVAKLFKSETLGWQKGTGNPDANKSITEESEIFTEENYSYVRWFRCQARGPYGPSDWTYAYHTYAQANVANMDTPVATENASGGLDLVVTWETSADRARPVDSTSVEYVMVTPEQGMVCPSSGLQWNALPTPKDTKESDGLFVKIDEQPSTDKVMFVRVNTKHDNYTTYGIPQIARYGFLKTPENLSVEIDQEEFTARVTATNSSEVPDAILMVKYVTGSGISADIAYIDRNHSYVDIQCPDWSEEDTFGFEVRAIVNKLGLDNNGNPVYGVPLVRGSINGVPQYYVNEVMRSATSLSWGGEVPKAPVNVNVFRTEVEGTIGVTWDRTWNAADGVQLSWADHADAWNSTEEPSTYEVSNIHAARWNISGLESGVMWYVRLRFFKKSGDTYTYGPWSNIDEGTINLASAPSIPVLKISEPIITETGSTIASWAYVSNDSTPQSYAEIDWIDDEGEYHEIAHTETAQHITINAEQAEFESGNIYPLVVMVKSASGAESEWSDPVAVTIAEPLECEIYETSLVEESQEVNPRTFEGEDVLFETDIEEEVTRLRVTDLEPIQNGTPWNATTADVTPYNFRKVPSVGHSINSEYDKIIGGTVAWNQLAHNFIQRTEVLGITIAPNNTNGSITITGTATSTNNLYFENAVPLTANHIYFLCGAKSHGINISNYGTVIDTGNGALLKPTQDLSNTQYVYRFNNGDVINETIYPQRFDLTAALGTTIADYVYSLETATAGTGVTWLKEHFPKMFNSGYMAYNAGTLKSVDGLQNHDTVGFNQWDEEWENGSLDASGQPFNNASAIRSKNFCKCVPSTTYYCTKKSATGVVGMYLYDADKNFISSSSVTNTTFTTPSNAMYFKIGNNNAYGTTYNNDICINLSKTTGIPKNGDYVAYAKHTYALDSDLTLRGIPKLDASNNLYYDGDTYASDGGVTRKYGIVDLGTLNWSQYTDTSGNYPNLYQTAGLRGVIRNASAPSTPMKNMICMKHYPITGSGTVGWGGSAAMAVNQGGTLYISDPAYSSVADFKTAMSGVYLVYELDTPTTETADPYTNPQVVNADGTEEYVSTSIVPVGHETYYADIYPISGYDEVSATIRGKNLWGGEKFANDIVEKVPNAVKNTVNKTINFPASSVMDKVLFSNNYVLKENTRYTLILRDGGTSNATNVKFMFSDGTLQWAESFVNGVSVTHSNPDKNVVGIIGGWASGNSDFKYEESGLFEGVITKDDFEPYASETYTAEFENTVYGGSVDLVSGVLTVTHGFVDMGTLNWGNVDSNGRVSASLGAKQITSSTVLTNTKCDIYATITARQWYDNSATGVAICGNGYGTNGNLGLYDSKLSNMTSQKLKETLSGSYVAYELATPQEIQLTPQQIQTLVGENYVYSEQGGINIRIAEEYTEGLSLKELPMTVTITGAGEGGRTTLAIERASEYRMDRPDGDEFTGYNNETIFLDSHDGEDEFVIESGTFDDGARYRIVATVDDGLQSSEPKTQEFEVHWTKQALIPSATAVAENNIVKITPTAPQQADATDYCDIYRLTADKPELIVSHAEFGTAYADPFPALNIGGHRVVFRTKNGDYITADDRLAWYDVYTEIQSNNAIIDFDDEQIEIEYGMTYSSKWDKDFKETRYLGGSVQGDWNKAVGRSTDLNGAMITLTDINKIASMRRLAAYTGICHVRTPDGSSYAADIQVQEDREAKYHEKIAKFTLKVIRIDPEREEGMTYVKYREMIEAV